MRIALLLALAPVVQCPLSKTEPCFVGIPAPKGWGEPKSRFDPCGGNPDCRDGYWVPPKQRLLCDGSDDAALNPRECPSQHCEHADCTEERLRLEAWENRCPHGNCPSDPPPPPPATRCKLTETADGYRVEATNGTCTFEMIRKGIEFPYFGNKAITARP